MTLKELWAYKEEMTLCAHFYKDRDHELSLLFREEASRASKQAVDGLWYGLLGKVEEELK